MIPGSRSLLPIEILAYKFENPLLYFTFARAQNESAVIHLNFFILASMHINFSLGAVTFTVKVHLIDSLICKILEYTFNLYAIAYSVVGGTFRKMVVLHFDTDQLGLKVCQKDNQTPSTGF